MLLFCGCALLGWLFCCLFIVWATPESRATFSDDPIASGLSVVLLGTLVWAALWLPLVMAGTLILLGVADAVSICR